MADAWVRIGELAKRAGVSVQAIRYYERHGLFKATPRRASGHREFPPSLAQWIRFITLAQGLGFSLREVRELKRIAALKGAARRAAIGDQLATRIADIDARIRGLTALRGALDRLRAQPIDDDATTLVERIAAETDRLSRRDKR